MNIKLVQRQIFLLLLMNALAFWCDNNLFIGINIDENDKIVDNNWLVEQHKRSNIPELFLMNLYVCCCRSVHRACETAQLHEFIRFGLGAAG
jgi:hypothetical protein